MNNPGSRDSLMAFRLNFPNTQDSSPCEHVDHALLARHRHDATRHTAFKTPRPRHRFRAPHHKAPAFMESERAGKRLNKGADEAGDSARRLRPVDFSITRNAGAIIRRFA